MYLIRLPVAFRKEESGGQTQGSPNHGINCERARME